MNEHQAHMKLVEFAASELVHKHDLEEIERLLIDLGVRIELVERLLLFIPSAFAAQHYEAEGIKFPQNFLVGLSGAYEERPYAGEPVYVAARVLAAQWHESGKHSLIGRVLDWSAEAQAIKAAKAAGRTPTEMQTVHHGLST